MTPLPFSAPTACLGALGAGNMAIALLGGVIRAGLVAPEAVLASDPSAAQRERFQGEVGATCLEDNREVVRRSRVLLLSTKPQVLPSVLRRIADDVTVNHLIVSIAAGVSTATLEGLLPAGTRCVRVMPNTPALVGAGASALAGGTHATDEDLALVEQLLGAVGLAVRLPEASLDAVTGLSGSGPAFVMLFIEALADGGVRCGLPRSVALQLAAQTVAGAAQLQLATGSHPAVLKDQVTSPGGTTIAGVAALERAGFRSAAIEAVVAATQRSQELSRPPTSR